MELDQQQSLSHAERQTAALESIRKILIGFVWAMGFVAFVAAIGLYIALVS